MHKPNVIFILADDMGYGDFSAFNTEIDSTPNLDSLVAEGTTLSECYASSPVCAPSRASLMTGRYPQRCGVIDTMEARGYDRLKTDETTMADIFKSNGYTTGLIGKWHLGAIASEFHPNNRGFDYFMGFRGGWNDYYDYRIERNGKRLECAGEYLTDVFSDDAVRFVSENKDQPFFLHLAYNAPHFPMQAPDSVIEKYRQAGVNTEAVACLRAMIEIMDSGIGRVLHKLEECGIAENTIIVFMSDNGPDFGGSGDDCLKRYNCGLRGEKMLAYEGGIKVPAVIKWPGIVKSGIISPEIIHGTDLLPTLISLCSLSYTKKIAFDGIDVSVAFQGKKLPKRRLFWQWNRYKPEISGNAAFRDGNWKLVHAPVSEYLDIPSWEIEMDEDIKYNPEKYTEITDKPVPQRGKIASPIIELFDLATDAVETQDKAAVDTGRVKEMEKQLQDWFSEVERERLR